MYLSVLSLKFSSTQRVSSVGKERNVSCLLEIGKQRNEPLPASASNFLYMQANSKPTASQSMAA